MKHIIQLILLNLILGASILHGETSPLSLTQEEAIELALLKNLGIKIKEIEPEIKNLRVREQKAAFDPEINVSYSKSSINDHNERSFSALVEGKTAIGTTYKLGVNSSDTTTANHTYSSFKGLSISQPLLRNFGVNNNWAFVKIAEKQHEQSQWELQQTVLDTIYQVVYAYNAYFLAKQNADIASRNRDLAKQLVSDNEKRIEQGMMSPVDIAVAKAELAVREERVLVNDGRLKILENNLKKIVLDQFENSMNTSIAIGILPPAVAPNVDLLSDFSLALQKQPGFKIKEITREIEYIQFSKAKNQQLINISVDGSFGKRTYGDSLWGSIGQLNEGENESSIGLRFSHSILNRRARSETAISKLHLRQHDLGIEQLKQNILLDLHSQTILVETNWQRIQASRNARELSNQMLEAEQKKLQAGTSSTFVVLRLQNDVANAQIREFQAISDYHLSQAHLGRIRGVI